MYAFLEGVIGKEIWHKMLGKGTILECDINTGIMSVRLRGGVLRIQFPQSFKDGVIYFLVHEENLDQELMDSAYSFLYGEENESWNPDELEEVFWVEKKGKIRKPRRQSITVRSKSKEINNPYDDWEGKLDRDCRNCKVMKRGDCAGLGGAATCEDYSPIPRISNAEKFTWPT